MNGEQKIDLYLRIQKEKDLSYLCSKIARNIGEIEGFMESPIVSEYQKAEIRNSLMALQRVRITLLKETEQLHEDVTNAFKKWYNGEYPYNFEWDQALIQFKKENENE